MPNATSAHQLITLGQADERYVLPLAMITTSVGNVGAGTDDLMTYSLPANSLNATGKAVRITAWGRTANNANAKTVELKFGAQGIASLACTINQLGFWKVDAIVVRTGSSAQASFASIDNSLGTVANANKYIDAPLESDTAVIIIKCTGAATNNNDLLQEGMFVELIGSAS